MPARALAHIAEPVDARQDHESFALGVSSSFARRAWRIRDCDEAATRSLELSGYSAALARLLASRGVTRDSVDVFLEPRLRHLLPDPRSFAHMEHAALRFAQAVERSETIAILGDYDVDGACAAALLLRFLRGMKREALLYVPDRLTEGYGPSVAAIRSLRERGASVLVTVDCGAAAHDAMEAARDCGLDAIVLDHHAVETNPPAFAHVNPNGPDDRSGVTYVCAAGLVFLFLVAVQRLLRERGWFSSEGIDETDLLNQLDLVALATIADVVPLTGINRAFVRQGLRKLERLERPGLAALARLASASPPFSHFHLGFIFGPRINAGGRVGRCDLGARLLATDEVAEADGLALELDRHNRERQAIEAHILEAADAMAVAQSDNSFLLLSGDGWHGGVVGIVAGRLKERHAKPALVAGFDGALPESIGRGSARSVAGVDLGALIRSARAQGILETGGGHAMAAGFTVRRAKLGDLGAFLARHIEPQRGTIVLASELVADAILSPSGADLKLLDDIDRAGPYGAGNPEPLFLMPDMLVVYVGIVGANHVRLRLVGRDGQGIGAIAFRTAGTPLGDALLKARSSRIHVAGKLKQDDYDGTAKVQLHLEDAAPALA
ncbi:MAG TPA: single-stranded-DNA-specific exonuclease RecJ [Micropepsaceae bacterium]|nr:single-stranded-DNA-specific exonuclease RecJ [Micropepsaceae bacterium]